MHGKVKTEIGEEIGEGIQNENSRLKIFNSKSVAK